MGYDAAFSLVWGRDLAHGHAPSFDVPVAPTPHPLANVGGAVLSLLGDGAIGAMPLVSIVCFAIVGWLAFRLGSVIFCAPVGLAFSAILLTRPAFVVETHQALIDVPFVALVLWASVLAIEQPGRWPPVLGALALAGLLRPEAWMLSAVYALYVLRWVDRSRPVAVVALAASAPVVWGIFDAVVVGDPFFSLTSTQEATSALGRPHGLGTAAHLTPRYLRTLLETPIVWGGFVGAVLALIVFYRRALLPSILLWLGLVAFAALGIAGLPVLYRYILVPGVMLALFCAVALFGWLLAPQAGSLKWAWPALSLLVLAYIAVGVPQTVRDIRSVKHATRRQLDVQDSLGDIARRARNAPSARGCAPIYTPSHRQTPFVAYWMRRDITEVRIRPGTPEPGFGLLVNPESPFTRSVVVETAIRDPSVSPTPPPGFAKLAANGDWAFYARCN